MTAFAYDFGGCGCDRCQPWIVTWAELTREVHAIARRLFPGIEAWLCTWWWSEEEYRLFAEWAADRAPGWAKAMVLHIPYGHDAMDSGAVPAGCQRVGFVHAGYGDVADNLDLYGRFGPPVAARRLPATLDAIAGQGATGFQAYSEGVHDDVERPSSPRSRRARRAPPTRR